MVFDFIKHFNVSFGHDRRNNIKWYLNLFPLLLGGIINYYYVVYASWNYDTYMTIFYIWTVVGIVMFIIYDWTS